MSVFIDTGVFFAQHDSAAARHEAATNAMRTVLALSFTDANTIAIVERAGIDSVLSFDDDFDGLVDRIDPTMIGD